MIICISALLIGSIAQQFHCLIFWRVPWSKCYQITGVMLQKKIASSWHHQQNQQLRNWDIIYGRNVGKSNMVACRKFKSLIGGGTHHVHREEGVLSGWCMSSKKNNFINMLLMTVMILSAGLEGVAKIFIAGFHSWKTLLLNGLKRYMLVFEQHCWSCSAGSETRTALFG